MPLVTPSRHKSFVDPAYHVFALLITKHTFAVKCTWCISWLPQTSYTFPNLNPYMCLTTTITKCLAYLHNNYILPISLWAWPLFTRSPDITKSDTGWPLTAGGWSCNSSSAMKTQSQANKEIMNGIESLPHPIIDNYHSTLYHFCHFINDQHMPDLHVNLTSSSPMDLHVLWSQS